MTDDELHVAYAALFETYQEITPTAAAFPVGKLNAPYAPSAVAMDADRHEYRPAADNPIFATMERRYGRSNRIWAMDRRMVSEGHIEFLQQTGRRYLVGAPKSGLKKFEHELLSEDWEIVREGFEVKKCPSPDGQETFILCRSADRREKEKAMHERFAQRIREGREKFAKACAHKKQDPLTIAQRVGRLKGLNSRAAGLFQVTINTRSDGGASVTWREAREWRVRSELSEGCYLLRSNIEDWSAEELRRTSIQLTEA